MVIGDSCTYNESGRNNSLRVSDVRAALNLVCMSRMPSNMLSLDDHEGQVLMTWIIWIRSRQHRGGAGLEFTDWIISWHYSSQPLLLAAAATSSFSMLRFSQRSDPADVWMHGILQPAFQKHQWSVLWGDATYTTRWMETER